MIKNSKTIKFAAIVQLFVGCILVMSCCAALTIPISGVSHKDNMINVPADYKEEVSKVMHEYFPEQKEKKWFWDFFATYEVFDFKFGETGVSFCIDRDYTIVGITLENDKEIETRYSVYNDGKIEIYESKLSPPCLVKPKVTDSADDSQTQNNDEAQN